MPMAILFWVLFLIWLAVDYFRPGRWVNWILAALIFLLGCAEFGFIVKG